MSDLVQNIIAALIIGLIIAVMAVIKNIQIKALVYSLPIPITAALIATGKSKIQAADNVRLNEKS